MSHYLAKTGANVTVLAPDLHVDQGLEMSYLDQVNIDRYFPGPFAYVTNQVIKPRLKRHRDPQASTSQPQDPSEYGITTRLYRAVRSLLDHTLFSDFRNEAFPFLYSKARRHILNGSYDVVICSHEPAVSILVGAMLRKHITWVVDLGDPISSSYLKPQFRWLARHFERFVLNHANGVSVTNNLIATRFEKTYRLNLKSKMLVLMQGADAQPEPIPPPAEQALTICFTGTFYAGFRDPKILDRCISEQPDIKWQFVGDNGDFYYLARHPNVEMIPKVDHNEAKRRQATADVLLSFGNRQPEQLPGKIFEYLASQKFIFHIYQSESDPTLDVVKGDEFTLVCKNVEEDISEALSSLVNRSHEVKGKTANRNVAPYTWETRSEQLVEFLNHLKAQTNANNP